MSENLNLAQRRAIALAQARLRLQSGDTSDGRDRLMQTIPAGVDVPPQRPVQQPVTEPRSIGETIYQNVVGRGDIDTPGERLGQSVQEMGRSFFPGVARGAAEIAGIPGTLSDVIDIPFERMGLLPDVDGAQNGSPFSGEAMRRYLSDATGGATEYRSDTTAGQYAGTIGEFLPGGTGGAGMRGLLAYGVVPAVASESAGQLTEGTSIEPYARAAAAIGTSILGGPAIAGRSTVRNAAGANLEQRRMAGLLEDAGIQPTVGQATGSNAIRRMEGTVSPRPSQIEDLTAAAMRSTGSTAARATPTTLMDASRRIGRAMDDALDGVSFRPTTAMAQSADDAVVRYLEMAPSATVVPRVRNIANEIIDAATNPSAAPIELSTLRVWRSALGRMTQSSDEATRNAARELRGLIDDATDAALTAAGRESDLQSLVQSRENWRNYLAVSDASTRAGSESGILSPGQLNQAIIRTQGRENYAIGRGTDLMETSRAAGSMLRPMPTVEAGGIRRLPYIGQLGAGGAGAAAGAAVADIPGAIIGGLLGGVTPSIMEATMRSRTVQSLLANPTLSAAVSARTAPGLLAGN